jgi:hypothetical protein
MGKNWKYFLKFINIKILFIFFLNTQSKKHKITVLCKKYAITNLADDKKAFCISDAERPFSQLSRAGKNKVGTTPRLRRTLAGVVNWEVAK